MVTKHQTITLPKGGLKENEKHIFRTKFDNLALNYYKNAQGIWTITWSAESDTRTEKLCVVGKFDEGTKPTADGKGMISNGFTLEVDFLPL